MNSVFIVVSYKDKIIKKEVNSNDSFEGFELIFDGDLFIYPKDNYSFINKKDNLLSLGKIELLNETNLDTIIIVIFEKRKNIFYLIKREDLLISNKENSSLLLDYITGEILIENNTISSSCDPFYLNDKCLYNSFIKEGDLLKIHDLEIYIYQDFYYSNYPFGKRYEPKEERYLSKIKKDKRIINKENKRFELIFEEIKPFSFQKEKSSFSLINIIPGIITSISMITYSILGYDRNNPIRLIIPISMFITMVLVPIINKISFNTKENKRYNFSLNQYLSYLDDLEKRELTKINKYISLERQYLSFNSLYSKRKDLNNLLALVIGQKKLVYDVSIPECDVKIINEKYRDIKNKIESYITSNYLNLLNEKRINIYSSNPIYSLKKIVYSLAVSYSPNDLKLGLYSSRKELFEEYYIYPHFYSGQKYRFFENVSEIEKIDDKVIVLSIEDEDINNENITFIYINNNINEDNYKYELDITINNSLLKEMRIPFIEEKEYSFSKLYSFNEEDILASYKNNDFHLKALFLINDKEPYIIDLHEKGIGPHGLIAGSTGSGKSEVIISLIYSLALRYSPEYLNFIIVDYKGGEIINSLTYLGHRLPHIVACIDNLEDEGLERLIIYISLECERRQRLFKEKSSELNQSIFNIDDYLKCGFKMSHLVIIFDEFAQIKNKNPKIIKDLISFSRIGRSLGIHLILSTQKPSGNIDDEIWTNSRFMMCLKVNNVNDSYDVIHSPLASKLKNPGELYFKIDDELFHLNSIYSKKENNKRIILFNKDYSIRKEVNYSIEDNDLNKGLKSIINLSINHNFDIKKIELSSPLAKSQKELRDIYHVEGYILGEADDYFCGKKEALIFNYDMHNLIVSKRNNELINLINYAPKDRLILVISDKNIELNNIYKYDEIKDIKYLFKMIKEENLEGLLIIDDILKFMNIDNYLKEDIYKIINDKRIKLTIISNSSHLPYKLIESFENKYLIDSNDENDIINIFFKKTNYKGKSFFLNNTVIPFVACQLESIVAKVDNFEPLFKKIPKIINKEDDLIGYSLSDHDYIYFKDKTIVTSDDEKVLTKYMKLFSSNKVDYKLIDKINRNEYKNILWIGQNIFRQNLFYSNIRELKEDEGILFSEGKERIIKLVSKDVI